MRRAQRTRDEWVAILAAWRASGLTVSSATRFDPPPRHKHGPPSNHDGEPSARHKHEPPKLIQINRR